MIDWRLVQLVHAIACGDADPRVLPDLVAEFSLEHDLKELLQRVGVEYAEEGWHDEPKRGKRWQERVGRGARLGREVLDAPNLKGFMASAFRSVCASVLGIDHLGRPLDSLTGRLASYMGDSVTAGSIAMLEEQR